MNPGNTSFSISSKQPAAVAACHSAMLGYAQRKTSVVADLQTAIKHDPECAFAHAALGLMLYGARNSAFNSKTVACLQQAEAYRDGATEHESAYIDALAANTKGDLASFTKHMEHALALQPTDIFGLSIAQSELFWTGCMDRSLQISERVLPHWNESVDGYAEFLASRAFDLEEANRFDEAENCGRQSVDLNPASVWATHAVAHVLLMQGRSAEGVDWIAPQEQYWDDCNQIKFHVWWHKCLFYIENKQLEAALEAYDRQVRNRENELLLAMPDLYIDLQNGASLLWRLEHAGVDVGDRWVEMAEVVNARIDDNSSPFTSAHFAMILAAVGSYELCDQLIENMQAFAEKETGHALASRYADAGIPAARAAVEHRRGNFTEVLKILMPVRHALWQMGGSHAQQDIFFQLLVDAAARLGRKDDVNKLLHEIELIGFVEPAKRTGYEAASVASVASDWAHE